MNDHIIALRRRASTIIEQLAGDEISTMSERYKLRTEFHAINDELRTFKLRLVLALRETK